MFITTREQGVGRRSRPYASNRISKTSKISLISGYTANSGGSSGSASTVTQASYSKESEHMRRRRRTQRLEQGESLNPEKRRRRRPHNIVNDEPDVFAYLVKDEEDGDQKEIIAEKPFDTATSDAAPEELDHGGATRSVHSDSGISMGDLSDVSLAAYYGKTRLPALHEHNELEPASPTHTWASSVAIGTDHRFGPDYSSSARLAPRIRTRSVNVDEDDSPHVVEGDEINHTNSPVLSNAFGYELIAEKLSKSNSDSLPPLFRQFKKTNYRMLLHLQDEIAEMEQELSRLDAADEHQRRRGDGSAFPATRRLDWRWTESDVQSHRLELLGLLYIKLEQYYQAILAANNVQKNTRTADAPSLERYRKWMREKQPLSQPESLFLNDAGDLISLVADENHVQQTRSHNRLALVLVLTTMLPWLLFHFVTGLTTRLVLIIVTHVLTLLLETTQRTEPQGNNQEASIWRVLSFSLSIIAALIT